MRNIAYDAFDDVSTITTVTISPDNLYYDLINNDNGAFLLDKQKSSIIKFFGNPQITSLTIPEIVFEIGADAFKSFNIKELSLPKSLKRIKSRAFYECQNLETVKLNPESSDIVIEASAFSMCTSLVSFDLSHVTDLLTDVFKGCTKLSDIVSNLDHLTFLGSGCFAGTAIVNITMPDIVSSLEYEEFSGCTSLENVEIIGDIKISAYAFKGCSNLKQIIFHGTIQSLDDANAFTGVDSLKTIYYCSKEAASKPSIQSVVPSSVQVYVISSYPKRRKFFGLSVTYLSDDSCPYLNEDPVPTQTPSPLPTPTKEPVPDPTQTPSPLSTPTKESIPDPTQSSKPTPKPTKSAKPTPKPTDEQSNADSGTAKKQNWFQMHKTLVIIVAVSVAALIIIAVVVFVLLRSTKTKMNETLSDSLLSDMVERPIV